MSKYMRKTPVEAIQWNPDNRTEFGKFVRKYTKDYTYFEYPSGNILFCYWDFNSRKHVTEIPKFGWVVREGKTLQFYKNTTFHKTFDDVPDDEDKEIIDTIIKDANKALEDVRASIKNGQIFAKYANLINPDGRLTKLIDDLYKDDEKTREEIKKNMSEGLKEMEDSDKAKGTESDTFESVLEEMKELHAKKNSDYGDAAHKNFLKYGPVASLSRLSEKMQRAEHILLSGKCEVKDEPLTSTLIDMAITSAMLYMEQRTRTMIDWERLVKAVLCTTILFGMCIAIACLPIDVLIVLAVVAFFCAFVFAFYKALGDIFKIKTKKWNR